MFVSVGDDSFDSSMNHSLGTQRLNTKPGWCSQGFISLARAGWPGHHSLLIAGTIHQADSGLL
jgi:hypothetical protein